MNISKKPNFDPSTQNECKKLSNGSTLDDPDLQEFDKAYEIVRKAVCRTEQKGLDEAANWSGKVLDYNVPNGKKIRGLIVLKAYKILTENDTSSERIMEACILGWCVEMLQGALLVLDDIMDNSAIRRGKPSWHKVPEVGIIAVNDGHLLEHGIYKTLKIYFGKGEFYKDFLHEFLLASQKTVYGQCLDMLKSPPNSKPRFELFTLEKYYVMAEHKTAYYTFCLPVHLAMHLVGTFTSEEFEMTKNICVKLGRLFQIQDDYLDIYGDRKITGKIGTDIIDGKCTWFSAYFFDHAPEYMKKIMIENYGVNTKDAVSKVMKLYEDLKLEEKYKECEKSLTTEIAVMVKDLPRKSLIEVFHKLMMKLNHRRK